MEENWCAFFIATQLEVTPEQAFELYRDGKLGRYNRNITQADVLEMVSFKADGMTYKEIGYMYGISTNAAYRRIKYYEKNKEVGKYA